MPVLPSPSRLVAASCLQPVAESACVHFPRSYWGKGAGAGAPAPLGQGSGCRGSQSEAHVLLRLADMRSALGARWNVVNWPYVEDNYNMATQGTVPVVAST